MPPEQDADHAREESLTLALLDLAGADSVRVIEALAAALVNDLRERPRTRLRTGRPRRRWRACARTGA